MLTLLKRSYPLQRDLKTIVISNSVTGLFIFLFLVLFQPFGIAVWNIEHKTLKLAGFGLISCLVPMIYQILKNVLFGGSAIEDKWTVWKEILSNTLILVLIAFCNLAFASFVSGFSINWMSFLGSLFTVFAIGIFPIAYSIQSKFKKYLEINRMQARLTNEQIEKHTLQKINLSPDFESHSKASQSLPLPDATAETPSPEGLNTPLNNTLITENEHITLIAENEKDRFTAKAEDVLYFESQDNYTSIIYYKDGKIKRDLIRSSLKRIESQLYNKCFLRCHRAYLVNVSKVVKVEGNAAGYKLSFGNLEEKIPVSRLFGKTITEAIQQL